MIRRDLEHATAGEQRHISEQTIAALRRIGGLCERCAIALPERRATAIVCGRALCRDCRDEHRMDKIAAWIHRMR
jgi:hypothetical protein